MFDKELRHCRNNLVDVLYKKGFLNILQTFEGKACVRVSFDKFTDLKSANLFLSKYFRDKCFSCLKHRFCRTSSVDHDARLH